MLDLKVYMKVISLVVIMLTLTACGNKEGDIPDAVLRSKSLFAEQLNVPDDEIKIIDMEQVEWTDSCFGLGGPAESCAAALTPGWRVHFEVNNQEYEVRLNESGTLIRSPQLP